MAQIVISSGLGTKVLEAAQRSASEHGLSILGVISKPLSKENLRALVEKAMTAAGSPKRVCHIHLSTNLLLRNPICSRRWTGISL